MTIGADKYIILDYPDDQDEPIWVLQYGTILFYYITYLPSNIISIITDLQPSYKKMYSQTVNGYYWANTCTHCNSLQGDWGNHCEPDSAFSPISKERAEQITLIQIEQKHDFPIVGSYGFEGSDDLIKKYANRKNLK